MSKISKIDFPLLIHIGEAKAASSWMQRMLFSNEKLGFTAPFGKGSPNRHLFKKDMMGAGPFEFSADECRNVLHPILNSESVLKYFPVISYEAITGTSRTGEFHSKELANRLVEVFPGARILYVIREQKSMLLSQYHQYVRRGGVWGLKKFLKPPLRDLRHAPYFQWDRFRYHRILKYYMSLFGEENVLTLPFELLRSNPELFVERILSFCHMEMDRSVIEELPFQQFVNYAHSALVMNARRPLNYLFAEESTTNPRSVFPIKNSLGSINRISEKIDLCLPDALKKRHLKKAKARIAESVGDYFTESNRITSGLTGIELSEYGYDL